MYDAIEYRGFAQAIVEDLAAHAGVPVWNGLTTEFHPTQVLCDLLTMQEHSDKTLSDMTFCFLGDARNNMGNSLMVAGCKMGMDVRLCTPKSLWPNPDLVAQCREVADETGRSPDAHRGHRRGRGRRRLPAHRRVGVDGRGHRGLEGPYRAPDALPGHHGCHEEDGQSGRKFMHCLPAFHNRDTTVGEQIYQEFGVDCMEVSEEVFESPASVVFDQAENRMHTIKAVMVATLGA